MRILLAAAVVCDGCDGFLHVEEGEKGKSIICLRVSSFHEINTHSAKQEESKNDIQALRSRICATDPLEKKIS